MTWVRLDDTFGTHPKFFCNSTFGALCQLIQVRAICYASQHLTDGRLPLNIVGQLTGGLEGLVIDNDYATELPWEKEMVKAKLWEPCKGGFMIHDYLSYNPSKEEILQLRELKKKAGQAGGQASAQARARPSGSMLVRHRLKQNPTTSPLTSSLQNLQKDSSESSPKDLQKDPSSKNISNDDVWLAELRNNPAYSHINFPVEFGRMDAWFTLPKNKHRKRTKQFILNWLNKIEAPMTIKPKSVAPPEISAAQRRMMAKEEELAKI
jgi:hypothetical protein